MKVIDRLIRSTESAYGIQVKNWKVIKHKKNSSIVIKIMTNNNEIYALKSLFVTPERQSFIVKSEQMLAKRGVGLAKPVSTLKGDLHMLYKKYPYVLYQWIESVSSKLENQNDLESIVKVMAKLHHASRELQYPPELQIYENRQLKQEYIERAATIEHWISNNKHPKTINEKIINRYIMFFKSAAQNALTELKKSKYEAYMKQPLSARSLVHGDLHHNNVLNTDKSKVFIDFEDIRYDLPSKDILRLYSMYTKNHAFHGETFNSMMKVYERNHSLRKDVKKLVLIDLLFPHIFERLLRKKKYISMNPKQLEHRIKQEKKKASFIYQKYFIKKNFNRGREDRA